MVGLSKGRLRYWARTGFFAPSFVEEDGRLPYSRFYSFKDIVALRTLELLRIQNNVPLQHLRKVAEKLSHLRDDLWTKTILFVENRKVVFVNPETQQPQEVVSGLTQSRAVARNAPVVAGTRISRSVLSFGYTKTVILLTRLLPNIPT